MLSMVNMMSTKGVHARSRRCAAVRFISTCLDGILILLGRLFGEYYAIN